MNVDLQRGSDPSRRTVLRALSATGIVLASGLIGCHHHTAPMFYDPPPPPQMLGAEIDQINEIQENNAEAAKFVVYQHEFELNQSEKGGKSTGGIRLNEAGEDHLRQIAAAIRSGVHYPVIVERSRTSSKKGKKFGFGVYHNPELDNRRRTVIVKALMAMNVENADQLVSVGPSFAQPLSGPEADQAYRRTLFTNQNNNGMGGGMGGGGLGGGGFQ